MRVSILGWLFALGVLAHNAEEALLLPHVLATLALRTYVPGTATALAFNLPLGGWLLWRAITEKFVQPSVFAWSGPLTVIAIVVSIPLLFAAGRYLSRAA